jgi:transcriptional regulator with XRE-family HTH domain
MTGKELESDREALGWPRSELARRLKCDEGTIRMMESNLRAVPEQIAAWLHPIATLVRVLQPPEPAEWMVRVPKRRKEH